MTCRIVGMASWLPPDVRCNSDWPSEFVGRSKSSPHRELVDVDRDPSPADAIAMRHFAAEEGDPFLGSVRRRVAALDVTSVQAESSAAFRALVDAHVSPQDVDVVLSWSAVPDRIVPSSASAVAHSVGASSSWAMGVDAACATPIAQLEFASALIESGRAKIVLLTQGHLMTRAFPMMHPASPNIGDAATALVVAASDDRSCPSLVSSFSRTHGEYYPAVTWCRGKEEDPPWWEAGPAHYLGSKDSARAQDLIRSTVRIAGDTVRDLFSGVGRPVGFDVLASVQPRRWIPGAICEALGVAAESPDTFDDLAHLGGCGVIVNLLRARDLGLLTPGTRCVLYAQGAGFIRSASLLEC